MHRLREATQVIVLALLAIALIWCGQLILRGSADLSYSDGLEQLVGVTASLAGMLIAGWWAASLTLAFLSEWLRSRGHHQGAKVTGFLAPEFMRRVAAAVLGLHLVGAPAFAGDVPHQLVPLAVTTAHHPDAAEAGIPEPEQHTILEPQWTPLPLPPDGGPLVRGETRAPASDREGKGQLVEVRPGDSLWRIAAAHLGPLASDVEVAAAWPLWHQENLHVIGPNPSLVLPGQLLRAPTIPQ